MRELNGFELKAVGGGLMYSPDGDVIGGDVGGFGGWGSGDFARMDGAGYRSGPVDFCGNNTLNVPESIFGVYQGEACRAHDLCYAVAEEPRATCDAQFLTNMQNNCDSNILCQVGAVVYYLGVSIGGSDSYGTPLQ